MVFRKPLRHLVALETEDGTGNRREDWVSVGASMKEIRRKGRDPPYVNGHFTGSLPFSSPFLGVHVQPR